LKNLIIGIVIVGNFIVQSTALHNFSFLGVLPNTTLIIIIAFAIHFGEKKGAVIGAIAGLIQDIIFGRAIGMNALAYMLTGYFTGMMSQKIIKENIVTPILLTAISTILNACINLFFIYFLGFTTEVLLLFRETIIVEMPYNVVLSIPIYIYITKLINSKIMKQEYY